MKKIVAFSMCLVVGSIMAAPQHNQTPMSIQLKLNQTTVHISLKSNRTTGYAWFLLKASRGLKPTGARFIAPPTKLVGAPGTSVWTFDVKKSMLTVPRVFQVTLAYMRPWDASTMDKKTFYIVSDSGM